MAVIHETLTLEDKFSTTFTKFLQMGNKAAGASTMAKNAAANYQATLDRLDRQLIGLNAQFSVNAQRQQAMVAAGKTNTAAFAQLETQTDRLGATIRDLTAQYNAVEREAREAASATKQFEAASQTTQVKSNGLMGTIRNLAGAFLGIQTGQWLVNTSDQLTQINARLQLMTGSAEAAAEANDQIYQAAMRARGAYTDMADLVSQLGTLAPEAFSDPAGNLNTGELIAFAEQLQKQMALSGTSTMAAQAAMLQLTQGLASGVLRGEELNSVLEQTPMVAKTIADYMGVNVGTMRELASEGAITADVVKNALLGAADETNAAFAQMPMTWGQVWASFKNTATMALQPVLSGINFLANNIDIIGPAVLGLAGAFAVFAIAANWTNIASAAMGAYTVVVNILNLAYGMLTGNMTLANAAATSLNATMLASPIFWVVAGIFLLIAALYAGVAAYNKFTGASISATGIVAGAFFTLGAMIWNQFIVPTQNGFAAFANFIGNVFNDPVTAVKVLFYDMALTVLGYIRSVANGIQDLINAIPGVEVNLTSGIESLYGTLQSNRQAAIDAGSYKEYIKAWEYKDLGDSFAKGYDWGSNLNLFGGLGGLGSGFDMSQFTQGVPAYTDSMGDMNDKLSDIAGSTKSIEKSVDMSDEDIKALVDVAERRYVNQVNLTSQTPVITVNGANTGRTAQDRRELADAIEQILREEWASGSVRSTAYA